MFSPLTQRCLSAVNQLVNAPLALRVDSRLSAPGPGPPAARSSSSSESSGMMHPRPAALPAPSQRLAPARIAAGWIAAGSGPPYPSRPGSMLNVWYVLAGPPSLLVPFSKNTCPAPPPPADPTATATAACTAAYYSCSRSNTEGHRDILS